MTKKVDLRSVLSCVCPVCRRKMKAELGPGLTDVEWREWMKINLKEVKRWKEK